MLDPLIFKSNDIRGVASGPDQQWDSAGARALGRAYVAVFGLAGETFVIGRDARHFGAEYSQAFIEAAAASGANVIDVGLASTDELWFASGMLGLPGVQFTASHNPAEYNGVKFCLPGAAPISAELLKAVAEAAKAEAATAEAAPAPQAAPGKITARDILGDYVDYLHSLVDLADLPKLRVVVDAGNGMAGLTAPKALSGLGVEVIGLYLDLDPDFPNHPPNPLEPANLVDARRAVVEQAADLGLVFDGDADRCFFIDERGEVVDPAVIIAVVARAALAREPGASIVVNTITSQSVAQVVAAAGGQLVVSPVGHTQIKARMAEHGAVFGGEHSAHYYFRDFWGADTGLLAALTVLSLLGKTKSTMSAVGQGLPHYANSGEINTKVADPKAVLDLVAESFAGLAEPSWPDGLLIRGEDWWVSVRESNTEPLLRLNVEAKTQESMIELRDRALAAIRKGD
ncbi:MAG: phosphomannomutase/phosphoglucomutase [Propionibacteriaceae bacterium]|jgi:phosphomannomutase|nr:phosphomannomutase/phosphoglucomutase [Propionibacteriaceae bacterium]